MNENTHLSSVLKALIVGWLLLLNFLYYGQFVTRVLPALAGYWARFLSRG